MICPKCRGKGGFPGTIKFFTCPVCKGHGEVENNRYNLELEETEANLLRELLKVVYRFGWNDRIVRQVARNAARVRAGEEIEK